MHEDATVIDSKYAHLMTSSFPEWRFVAGEEAQSDNDVEDNEGKGP